MASFLMDTKTLSFEVPHWSAASPAAAKGTRTDTKDRFRAAPADFSSAKTFSFQTNFKIVLGLGGFQPAVGWSLKDTIGELSLKDTKTFSFETDVAACSVQPLRSVAEERSEAAQAQSRGVADAKTFSFETDGKWSLKGAFVASALAAKTFSFETV